MNRDGYRADHITAAHEAAHAVVAVLSGLTLDACARWAPGHDCPPHIVTLLDVYAAGYAWEVDVLDVNPGVAIEWADSDLRWWLHVTDGRMSVVNAVEAWEDATFRVRETLLLPDVQAAVREVADTLRSRKSGEIWGTTVERICRKHGLTVPATAQGVA